MVHSRDLVNGQIFATHELAHKDGKMDTVVTRTHCPPYRNTGICKHDVGNTNSDIMGLASTVLFVVPVYSEYLND